MPPCYGVAHQVDLATATTEGTKAMTPRETYTKKTLFLSQAPNFNFELNAEQILEKALEAGFVTKIGDDLFEINNSYGGAN